MLCFPDSSVGKESTCNAGDPGLIPGSGRSPGEGTGYPLQDSWASLVAQLVKNPPAMQETWVWPVGQEDPLEKGKATHSWILAWRIPWTLQTWVCKESTRLSDFHFSLWCCRSLNCWYIPIYFHFCFLYFWYHIQKTIAKFKVMKLSP